MKMLSFPAVNILFFAAGTTVFIIDPEYAKRILVLHSANYDMDKTLLELLPMLGTGLLTTSGKKHALMRKHLNPAFTLGSVKQFITIFNEKSCHLVKVIDFNTVPIAASF